METEKIDLKGHIQYVLGVEAKRLGCKVEDLEYRVEKSGAIHIRKKAMTREQQRSFAAACANVGIAAGKESAKKLFDPSLKSIYNELKKNNQIMEKQCD